MEYLYERLRQYEGAGYYGFHMPGHKRGGFLTDADLPYGIDITEIEGFDDLHHACGILQEAQKRAAFVYHADETHYLINGSTVGLLCAILGCTRRGERILMARNCHRSVYNAVLINELRPVYIYPQRAAGHFKRADINGPISAGQVEQELKEHSDIRAVVITSPTYDGVVSDVRMIAEVAHRKGIPLILDEAHGAHFGFHPYFPENGNQQGADIVIHSLHKTLPSLTQTALLHMNGGRIDRSRVRMYLHMLQSSSPSYVLMASIDECIRVLTERREEIFGRYTDLLEKTRRRLRQMRNLSLGETDTYDRSKLLILLHDISLIKSGETVKYTGKHLYHELNDRFLIQMEMAAPRYVIGITSPGDTEDGMGRLVEALTEIDRKLDSGDKNMLPGDSRDLSDGDVRSDRGEYSENRQICPLGEMDSLKDHTKYIPIDKCSGYVAAEYAYLYPPGIPLVVPGERISEDTMQELIQYGRMGFDIRGTRMKGKIEVLENG